MSEAATIANRASADVAELEGRGAWSRQEEIRLEAIFERCAVRALRVPAMGDRSRHLRRLGKRFIPVGMRPAVRRLVGSLDHLLRAANARR